MITINEHPVLTLPQDWSGDCRYDLTTKTGRSDNLLGKEDRVRYTTTSRRTYKYEVLARSISERIDFCLAIKTALALKKCAVPIWCKARYDFSKTDLEFVFTGTVPELESIWVLYCISSGDLSVIQADSYTETGVSFSALSGDGLHDGELIPLLFGYISAPQSEIEGGDSERYTIEFTQAQL